MSFNARFKMSPLVLVVLVLTSFAQASPSNFARLVPQVRTTYNGGWPLGLSSPGCPADASVSCQGAESINPTCCPFGQTCFGYITPYCCPTNQDCQNVVNNLPVCANSTWNMYQLSGDGYICCEQGQVGMNPQSGEAGICEPANQPVVTSLLATLASQIGGPPITSGPGGGAATATPTGDKGKPTSTASGTGALSTETGALSSSAKNVLKKFHLTLGEIVGIAAGGAVLIALLAAAIWCCCRRRGKNRTQVTYVEPYRNQGDGYNPGYTGYAGTRGLDGDSDGLPLTNVAGYAQESKVPVQSQVYQVGGTGYDERVRGAELGYDERR